MDAKDGFMFLVLLLLSLGLFGSLSLTYCVWNRQTEVASELQSELHELQKRSEIANIRDEQCNKLQSEVQDLKNTNSKLQSELADVQNVLHKLQNELKDTNSREHLGASEPSQDKGQLKRNVRQADEDTDMLSATELLTNALTEIIERKLVSYMNCDKNEYNHTKCTLKPGPKGEPGDMGHIGEPGDKGTKGNVGYPGYKGEKGEEGVTGPQGPLGPTGPQGPRGIQGDTGERGDMGKKGEPGDKGMKGNRGYTGYKGEKGRDGVVGPQGLPGPIGQQGPHGIQGDTGERGDMGQKGEPGDKGMKGNRGYPGYKGEGGEEGVVGPQGPPGPTGPRGSHGIQGKDGVKGEQGGVGDTGLPGPRGDRGDKGDMGERGLKGDVGPPGPKGETGERGDTGQKGEPGNKGMRGNRGYKGEKGDQGPPGMTWSCGGTGGWRRVVFLNMTNTSHVCPAGLNLTTYSRRTCGRAHSGLLGCSSTTFSVGGSQYSRVCGRALAYQFGHNYAFYGYHNNRQVIDGYYVDGLSLTHGASGSRQHIWTFASGWFTGSHNSSWPTTRCPCDNGNTYPSPPFVGNDYFCESVITQMNSQHIFYPNATLWDGQVCAGGGTCCKLNNPPRFTKNLANSTTEDIELRLCLYSNSYSSDIALEQLELYVQ